MKKLRIIAAILLVPIGIAVICFICMQQIGGALEDDALTKQFSSEFAEQLKLLKGKYYYDFPDTVASVEWDGKYLVVEHAVVETKSDGYLNFRYNKKLNEWLGTDRFFPNGDINGVVWIYSDAEVIGEYAGGGRAFRPYYVLHYIDLKRQVILAQDTLLGSMPPQTISAGQMGGSGKMPNNSEIIETIKNRVK